MIIHITWKLQCDVKYATIPFQNINIYLKMCAVQQCFD